MRTILDRITTPSSLLACGIMLFSAFLLISHNKLNHMLWRVLCFAPLLACVIHALVYNFRNQWVVGLMWFGLLYATAILIALWQFVDQKEVLYRIITGLSVVLSVSSFVYIPAGIPLPPHLHNYSHQSWTDSFISTVHAMEEEYPISDWKGIDYDALLEEFVPRIQEAEQKQDTTELGVILFDFTNRFYDGHVSLDNANSDITLRVNNQIVGNDYGLSLISLDNGDVVAVCVEPDGEAARQGIRTGTVITHWNGVPVQEAKYSYFMPIRTPVAENEEPKRTMLLAGQGGETVTVTFLADDGQSRTVALHRMGEYMTRFRKAYGQYAHQVEKDENFSYKMISDTCGYLRIHSEDLSPLQVTYSVFTGKAPFVTNKVDEILQELQSKGMTHLVIDIRNNTGGLPQVSAAVASLFAEETFIYSWGYCTKDDNGQIHKNEPLVVPQNGKWKDLPVVVLVNQNTVSSGDIMADLLSSFSNVTLMGMTPSNGSGQMTGGFSVLADGYFSIYYPVVLDMDKNNNPTIDTDTSRETRIPLEVEIPINEVAIEKIFGADKQDYELEYAVDWLRNNS